MTGSEICSILATLISFSVQLSTGQRVNSTPLTGHDDTGAPRVAVINQQFARDLFHSASSALCRYFKLHDGTRVQVVGIAEDGKYASLTEDQQLAAYFPARQSPSNTVMLVVRSDSNPQNLSAAIRSKVRDLDPGLATLIQTRTEAMGFVLFPARMATVSLGVLGVLGAMLSITGIFGLAAYTASKHKRELGIRIALGAQDKQVLQAALGRAFSGSCGVA